MQHYLLDVVEESWLRRNGKDIIVLTIAALIAIVAIIGIFIWKKKRKNK